MSLAKTTSQRLFASENLRAFALWDEKNLQFQDGIANH
jgi:hypothetical protein